MLSGLQGKSLKKSNVCHVMCSYASPQSGQCEMFPRRELADRFIPHHKNDDAKRMGPRVRRSRSYYSHLRHRSNAARRLPRGALAAAMSFGGKWGRSGDGGGCAQR